MIRRALLTALAIGVSARAYSQDYSDNKNNYSVSKDGGVAVSSGYLSIKDETTPLTPRSILTFLGSPITCVDNGANFATECTVTTGSGYNLVMEEGAGLTARATLNFIGSAITCADNAGATRTDCTLVVPTSYATVDDEGTPLTQRTVIDFAGAGVTCADSGGTKTLCTIPGAGGSTPTGTGFRHVTAGVEDGATKLVDTADVNASQITNAKLANMVTVTVKSNLTGGAAAPSDNTVTQVVDVLGTTRASVPYRGAATWSVITPTVEGTSARFDGTDLVYKQPIDPTTEQVTFDDFGGFGTSGTATGSDIGGWQVVNLNSGVSSKVGGLANHPGIQSLSTASASASGTSEQNRFGGGALGPVILSGNETWDWLVQIPTASNGTDRFEAYFGLDLAGVTATAAERSDGVFAVYSDNQNSGQWLAKSCKASTCTTLNSAVTMTAGNWYHLKFVGNAGGTSYEFFVNGTDVGALATNIPVVTIAPVAKVFKQLGTTGSGVVWMDYFYMRTKLSR